MFRKYASLAAALLLAATATPAFAGDQSGIPTCKGDCATQMLISPTGGTFCATCGESASTCGMNCAVFSAADSTLSPQQSFLQKASASQRVSPGHDYTTQSLSAQEQKMLNLLNQDRKNAGLAALTPDPELSRIARIKSEDMRDKGYFAHESPTYGNVRAMLRTFGYAFRGASENIAHHANVDKAQAAFMSSSGHRANILSAAWTKVGIGICLDRNGYLYATQIFAR